MPEPAPFRIATEKITAVLRTSDQLIVGQLHARPQKRLKDEMNHVSDRFIAVTAARVHDVTGTRLLYETSFLLVSNAHVVSITPVSALTQLGDPEWVNAVLGNPPAALPVSRNADRLS
jgi:hypothetical protein